MLQLFEFDNVHVYMLSLNYTLNKKL